MTGTVGGEAGREAPVPPLTGAAHAPGARSPAALGPTNSNAEFADDFGLFGPETVTWRIHSDPLIGLAMLRSLALRVLHPEGLAGVFATTDRMDDPWGRLTWTLRHLGIVTFGNRIEAAMMGARLRAVLMQVRGVKPGGAPFRGDDPELLLWMHCCQVASLVEVTRRGGLLLTDAEHEAYIREQVRLAALWGLEPDAVPDSRRELTRFFRHARPALRMTSAGRAFIGAIVAPALPDVMALAERNRPAWAPVAGLVFGTLPIWARQLYSTPPSSGPAALSQSATTLALHSLRDSLRGRHDQTRLDQTGLGFT